MADVVYPLLGNSTYYLLYGMRTKHSVHEGHSLGLLCPVQNYSSRIISFALIVIIEL